MNVGCCSLGRLETISHLGLGIAHDGQHEVERHEPGGLDLLDCLQRPLVTRPLRATASCARWAAAHGTSWHTSFLQYFISKATTQAEQLARCRYNGGITAEMISALSAMSISDALSAGIE